MKKFTKIVLALGSIAATANTFAMDEDGWASTYESLSAFENKGITNEYFNNRPGYVKPIIDNLGNVLNSNWYISAEVPQSFTIEFGLPFSIIPIGNDDREFSEYSLFYGMGSEKHPTIFGDHAPLSPDIFGVMSPDYNDKTVYGNETLNGLGVFTYPYLQAAAGFYHARIVLRGMFLPSISELTKFNLFGFGLQYSFGHFFQYMLPPIAQGLNVSVVYGYNTSSIGYRPDEYKGSLDLDISTHTFDVVLGYKPFSFIEIMMTLGYQSATMESSGHLYQSTGKDFLGQDNKTNVINPNISVDGNNGFKFGLAVAFQLGSSYHPVIGFDYAGKTSFTTNALYFRQQIGKDKTPDEIAKEKGYVRGAKDSSKENAKKKAAEEQAVREQEVRDNANEAYRENDNSMANSDSTADEMQEDTDFSAEDADQGEEY